MAEHMDQYASELSKAQQELDAHGYRVEVLERVLKQKHMNYEEREMLEKELESIKAVISAHEKTLKDLQIQSRQTPILAWLVIALCVIVYLIYMLVY